MDLRLGLKEALRRETRRFYPPPVIDGWHENWENHEIRQALSGLNPYQPVRDQANANRNWLSSLTKSSDTT